MMMRMATLEMELSSTSTMPSVTSIEGDVRKGSAPLTIVLDSDPSSSLLWKDLRTESSIDRSRMLLSGKFEELKKSLNTDELRSV
jgi:hypothetical protein